MRLFIIMILQLLTLSKGQNCPTHGPYNITQFGDKCQYRCRCVNEEQCARETGHCTNGCARGWMGPGCQYRNIAPLHTGTTQANDVSNDARLAADGNITTCSNILPQGAQYTWWQIELPRVYYIVGFVIKVNREANVNFRIEGSNLTDFQSRVSCNNLDSMPPSTKQELMCFETMVVKHIRIFPSSTTQPLGLCEVEIYGGRYISFRGRVNQSSDYERWPGSTASAAVDGRPMLEGDDPEIDAERTCAVTERTTMPERWMFEFTKNMLLQCIYVYGRRLPHKPEFIDQITRFSVEAIHVSIGGCSALIYEDNPQNATWNDYQPRAVDLIPPILSSAIVLLKKPNTLAHLTLCEVEVYAECDHGKCGWNCSDVCHCSTVTTGTYRLDGICPYGCATGWSGQNGRCDSQNCPTHGHYNITQFGDKCQYRCRCVNEEQCVRETGHCTNGCARGWMGPGCQYRNIAPLHTGTTQANDVSNDARLAADGNITTCSNILPQGAQDTWWKIELPRVHYIVGFVIRINTEENVNFRIEGSNLTNFKSRVPCNNQENTLPSTKQEIMCFEAMVVKHIRIFPSSTTQPLGLCEVEIYGGRYISFRGRVNQSSDYESWPGSTASAAVDGRPMLEGDDPEIDAERTCAVTERTTMTERWMLECTKNMLLQCIYVYGRRLPHKPEFIDQISGFSVEAISIGGSNALIYEDNPQNSTWNDYQPRAVDLIPPILSSAIVLLKKPNTLAHLTLCEVEVFAECEHGKCGWNCLDVCQCSTVTTGTYRLDGICPYGCVSGWRGQNGRCDSNMTCGDHLYGKDCRERCGNCINNEPCDITTGHCPGGCQPGWTGRLCIDSCPRYTYGTECTGRCGMCKDSQPCDIFNGECYNECETGYQGKTCKARKETNCECISAGPIIGGFAAVIALLVLVIVCLLLYILRTRRQQQSSQANEMAVDSYATLDTNSSITETHLYETMEHTESTSI